MKLYFYICVRYQISHEIFNISCVVRTLVNNIDVSKSDERVSSKNQLPSRLSSEALIKESKSICDEEKGEARDTPFTDVDLH